MGGYPRVLSGDAFDAFAEKLGVTAREGEIVRLLLEGHDSKRISEKLFISDHTVKNHIHHIYRKLGIRNRMQLVRCFQSVLEDPGRPPNGPMTLRRIALPAAVLILALAAALVAWRPWGRRPRPAAFPPPPALAVLDFENLSGEADIDKWVMGLPLLLATDLGQSKYIRTLSDEAVYGALEKRGLTGRGRFTREEFRKLARDLKADYVLTGNLMRAGGAIVVTAFLQDARTGTAVRSERLDCADERDLMRKMDGLARLIRSHLIRTAAQAEDEIDLDIEKLTTASALAYEYYSEGWRYHRTGDYAQGLIALQRAVEIDPEFAMAYRMMSVAARNLRSFQREEMYGRKAFELSERLPEDCRERHLIRADYYSLSEATQELAVAEFRKVLEARPHDTVANNNLAILCIALEDFESALRYADVPVRQGSVNPYPHYTKAEALWALDRGAEAERTLRDFLGSNPPNRLILQTLAALLIAGGREEAAAAALDAAMSAFPDPSWSYWRAELLLQTEGAAAAREEVRRLFLLEDPPWHLRARMEMALIDLASGRISDAEKECRLGRDLADSVEEAAWASDFRNLLGQILLDRGDPGAAMNELRAAVEQAGGDGGRRRAAMLALSQAAARSGDAATVEALRKELQEYAASGPRERAARVLDLLTGLVALEGGRAPEAVTALERAAAAFSSVRAATVQRPLVYYHLGSARARAGDHGGAKAAFGEILKPNSIRLTLGEIHPLAVLGRARADDALGDRASAAEGYRSFLALWAQADPGRPEVEEARARLAALAGPSSTGR